MLCPTQAHGAKGCVGSCTKACHPCKVWPNDYDTGKRGYQRQTPCRFHFGGHGRPKGKIGGRPPCILMTTTRVQGLGKVGTKHRTPHAPSLSYPLASARGSQRRREAEECGPSKDSLVIVAGSWGHKQRGNPMHLSKMWHIQHRAPNVLL